MSGKGTKDLVERIRNGQTLDLGRPGDVRDLSLLPSETWQERTVAASVVKELCISAGPSKQLRIDGARIEGDLDLTAVRCQSETVFANCLFTGRIILVNAHLVSLDLSGSTLLKDMSAKNLHCGPLTMRDAIAKDCVDLRYAEIDGPFECQDAEFEADVPESLVIREATISRSALLTRARVSGAVIANAITVRGALICTEMEIGGAPWTEGETDRFGRRRGRILGGSRVAFMLNFARIDGPVDLGGSALGRPFSATGLVSMYSAHMAALGCEKAIFTNADEICLSLEHAEIANSVLLRRGFTATGTVRLYAAEIGDALEMDGASLTADAGHALNAERVRVAGPVMLRTHFKADGCVRFSGATIGSFVNCSGASFHKPSVPSGPNLPPDPSVPHEPSVDDIALSFEGAEIGADLIMNRGFHATGRLVLRGAKIKGSLILGGRSPASIRNDKYAIDAFALSVGQAIVLRWVTLCGVVDFSQASCTVLEDEIRSWPDVDVESRKISPGKKPKDVVPEGYPWVRPNKRSDKILVWKSGIYLGGLTFDILRGPDVPWEKRREIFKEKTIDRTNPQPYLQLAKIYNQTGETSTARKVQVARLNASTHPLSPSRWILRPLIGYGYQPLRAALVLAAVALIGGFLFALAAQNDLLVPTKAPTGQTVVSSECHPKTYPCFHPYAYSVDSLLPVLNLKERDFWIPNVQQAPLVGILAWSLNGIGWIVGLLVIAGFTNIVRKE